MSVIAFLTSSRNAALPVFVSGVDSAKDRVQIERERRIAEVISMVSLDIREIIHSYLRGDMPDPLSSTYCASEVSLVSCAEALLVGNLALAQRVSLDISAKLISTLANGGQLTALRWIIRQGTSMQDHTPLIWQLEAARIQLSQYHDVIDRPDMLCAALLYDEPQRGSPYLKMAYGLLEAAAQTCDYRTLTVCFSYKHFAPPFADNYRYGITYSALMPFSRRFNCVRDFFEHQGDHFKKPTRCILSYTIDEERVSTLEVWLRVGIKMRWSYSAHQLSAAFSFATSIYRDDLVALMKGYAPGTTSLLYKERQSIFPRTV